MDAANNKASLNRRMVDVLCRKKEIDKCKYLKNYFNNAPVTTFLTMIIMNVEVTLTAPGWKEADLHDKLTPGLNVQRSTFKTCQLPDLYPWLGTGSRRSSIKCPRPEILMWILLLVQSWVEFLVVLLY